jgi:hypothetical protein
MADNDDDDIYNDPATIGDVDDDINGAPDNTPPSDDADLSQSIYVPEKDTTDLDDRGDIDELELSDASQDDDLENEVDPALLDDNPTKLDPDTYRPGDMDTNDEEDDTER